MVDRLRALKGLGATKATASPMRTLIRFSSIHAQFRPSIVLVRLSGLEKGHGHVYWGSRRLARP